MTAVAQTFKPRDEAELAAAINLLRASGRAAEVRGARSKQAMGRGVDHGAVIETTGLSGITLYEPTELVMGARAGTPVAQIESALAERGQMLAFEPLDLGPVTGGPGGIHTIGGVFATGISGPRRIVVGAARDHLLGVRAVNGRGEVFKSGGRVLKNVTGYDVARALTGSWGTLAVLSEVTFKVMPRAERTETLVFSGHTDEIAIELMSLALGTPFEVSGAVHLTAALTSRLELRSLAREAAPVTAIRVENFASSIEYRAGRLQDALKIYGTPLRLGHEASLQFWGEMRRLSVFVPLAGEPETQVWRISTAPRQAAKVMAAIRRNTSAEACFDASGGIIWLEVPASADAGAADLRRILAGHGGHATLMRADASVRASVEVFHPMTAAVARITAGLKDAFDPDRVLNPGRMYASL
jgi:glycolate oxidase FAD binding subunit